MLCKPTPYTGSRPWSFSAGDFSSISAYPNSKAQVRRPAMQIPPPTPSFFSSKLAESFPRGVKERERKDLLLIKTSCASSSPKGSIPPPRETLGHSSLSMTEERGLSIPYCWGRITFFHKVFCPFTESKLFFRKRTFIPKKQKSKKTW